MKKNTQVKTQTEMFQNPLFRAMTKGKRPSENQRLMERRDNYKEAPKQNDPI